MGFLDKLKDVARSVTGGGAKVTLEADPGTLQKPFAVRIKAVVADAPLQVTGVYLLVKSEEEIRIEGQRLEGIIRTRVPTFQHSGIMQPLVEHTTAVEFRIEIAGPQQLEAKKEYTWQGQVTLPAGSKATYVGKSCQHRWVLQAGLDAAGNDPDSGWIPVTVT